jgi:hypothetical protein
VDRPNRPEAAASPSARLLTFFRLDEPSMLFAFGSIVAGGIGLLTTNQLRPVDGGGPLMWLVYWLVIVAGVALVVHGILSILILLYRSGRLAWAYSHLVRFRSPVYVAKPGDTDDRPQPDGLRMTGSVAATLTPGAPRPGLTLEEALRGWQRDRGRLRQALDIAITWLYRREHWAGLSHDGKFSEAAPAGIWGDKKYKDLGLEPLVYAPPPQVPVEPGWTPPSQSFEVAEAGNPTKPKPRAENHAAGAAPTRPRPGPGPLAEKIVEGYDAMKRQSVGRASVETRPPKARKLSDDVWSKAKPEYCRRLLGLIERSMGLTRELQEVPVSAPPNAERKARASVVAFVNATNQFVADYYTLALEDKSLPEGDTALGPAWRQKLVTTVTRRAKWLQQQARGHGCNHATHEDEVVGAEPAERR